LLIGFVECAYGLRYVEKNGYGDKKEPWSVRQTAIYQKYKDGMETWVFISASKQAETKAIEFIDQFGINRPVSTTPFDLHLILLEVALANWRWYIKSLVERTTEHSSRVIAATVGKGKLSALIDFEINFEDRQVLKVIEDKALDLLTIFESTSDTITTLLREYEYVHSNTAMKRDRVVSKLQDNLREVELYAKKVDTLHKRVQGTASLVSSFDRRRSILGQLANILKLSNLLDYENAKIAQDNGDSLKILAQESREENVAMRLLSEKSTKDAAAVKVITLITIVFLPTTVVSVSFPASIFCARLIHQAGVLLHPIRSPIRGWTNLTPHRQLVDYCCSLVAFYHRDLVLLDTIPVAEMVGPERATVASGSAS
jgi:hypothetical protein